MRALPGERAFDMTSHHAQSAQAVIEALGSNSEHGLSDAQVTELRSRYGYNQLAGTAPIPLWHKFAGQFKSLVIWILITAAIISGMMREWLDTLVILSLVLLNAMLFWASIPLWENGKTWSTWALRSQPAKPRPLWWPPAWRPSWGASPICCGAMNRNRPRCNAGFRNWARFSLSFAWPSWAWSLSCSCCVAAHSCKSSWCP